jgi:ABC-type Fe3+/spermidine/putrescine transport system ATPase subunit
MRDSGKTIIFVTHDMGSMQRFCHRALLLERGSPVYMGDPHEVADRYLELNFGRDPEAAARAGAERSGDGEARVIEAWVEDADAERIRAIAQQQRLTLSARVRFMVDVEDPSASVYVLNAEHKAVLIANSGLENERSGQFRAGEEVVFSFSFDNVLSPGRYSPMFTLAHRGSGLDVIDRFEGSFSFVVTGPYAQGGVVDLPVRSTVSRSDVPPLEETEL